MLIRSVRMLLHLVRTPPLSDALDLRNYETAPEDANYYWIGDADPDKVRCTGPLFHRSTHRIVSAQVSDAEIEAFIRKYGQSATHPVSTQ